ncbi:hypothetical protein ACUB14_001612 [Pseudomonas aeruginosa]|jgi:hypothetical protein|uniref:C2H2-type domain-containing protein n=3 Tax=Pseudomonas aeruginosa group TaxID=136841 RepID=A0ABD7JS25_PSEAI|nr:MULTISPECIES: hypothetical protein [Pseudomonas]AVX92856.1 hypothetical protein PkP19E3_32465 [Pseudomonas koreensis]MDU7558969.1 hypothetical protein [Pseudomonas sp.]AVE21199.1 Hypothetical protein [Pseudomonas aeruginosa]AVK09130.1 hypothetical protein CSB93_6699 [Pseudomonas paraeruginosa]AWE95568.1 hypothetical protein CSC28_6739 [Pseudomonas paraeruginosa]
MSEPQHNLSTSAGGRGYLVDYFQTKLGRYDFTRYIRDRLAADFACILSQHLTNEQAETDTMRAELQALRADRTAGWRCFHCGEHFLDEAAAALHFGTHEMQSPACLIDVAEYREMEARMRSYNDEDAEIHRAMARQRTQHQIELRRAEEQGYARGLKEAVGLILDKQMQED